MDFEIVGDEIIRTVFVTIATGEVIEAGDMCELSNGLPVKGTATGAKLAYAIAASASGDTQVELTVGDNFTLKGTGEVVFAVAQKGDEVDMVIDTGVQQVDNNTSSTNVFVMDISENAGVVGSASDIRFRILKPLF